MLLLLFSWGTFLWEREGEKRDGGNVGTVQRCEICVVLGCFVFFFCLVLFFVGSLGGGRERARSVYLHVLKKWGRIWFNLKPFGTFEDSSVLFFVCVFFRFWFYFCENLLNRFCVALNSKK